MKIENDITKQTNNIDTTDVRNILDKIGVFEIYDGNVQIHVSTDCNVPVLKAMAKKQNVNAWFSKCNYIIHYIKKDFEQCLQLIEEDKDIFVGYRVSKKDKEKFYLLENIEYRLFTLCDVLSQMFNELLEIESNIGKVHHNFFFKRKELKRSIEKKYDKNEELKKSIIQDITDISQYFETDDDYKYLSEKRNSFTHRENPHDCVILNSSKKKTLVDHPLYELNRCVNVFEWLYLKICTVQKLFFFMLKNMGVLPNYVIVGLEKW